MSKRSRVSHSGIGSQKARTSAPAADIDTQKIAGAQAMLDKLQEVEEEPEEVEDSSASAGLRDLRELIFLGRVMDEIKIDGFSFEMSTLTSKEKRDLVISLSKVSGGGVAAHLRTEALSFALKKVNGVPLEELYEFYGGSDEEADVLDKKRFILENMQASLVEKLFEKYEALVEQSESSYSESFGEDIKK